MSTPLAVILCYLLLLVGLGFWSNRRLKNTGEDFFVASRTIGPFLLLMSLFGTNMTTFAILGSSGEAYHEGIGVFGLMASSSSLVIPCVFFFIGTRVWALGKRHGYLTQVQYFRERWGSDHLGLLLFAVLIALLIPYLLIGVMAGGLIIQTLTGGPQAGLPQWVGSVGISAVVLTYVFMGGLRGTAWANAFQTVVFMVLGLVTFIAIVNDLGGIRTAMEAVVNEHPHLLHRAGEGSGNMNGHDGMNPWQFFTYTFTPLSVGMFPHMFMHWLTARRAETFRTPLILYPLCIAAVWIPAVILGILGSADPAIPALQGAQSNSVLILMISEHAAPLLAGLLGAGVLAAAMSSLDSQVLSAGTMFTQDIVVHYKFHKHLDERTKVILGRVFVTLIILITCVLSFFTERSIFKLAVWSFAGFAGLFPVVAAALFWRRSTRYGAAATILTVAGLWTYFFLQGWETPGYTVGGTGVMPVFVLTLAGAASMIVVSLLSSPPPEETLEKFFPVRKP
ncbi:MAG: sodium:solute symporter family protein [Acidobacteria bacterium]|nr:sodium:solute symporter family protein [Acidobacteriota bacterium]